MKEIKVREDLNEIVGVIGFKHDKNRYGTRDYALVKLFNGVAIEFKDTDGLYDLFKSYEARGIADFIKSKELVEEYKKDSVGQVEGTYICVRYTIKTDDGEKVYRLFPTKFTAEDVINNYYKQFKEEKKAQAPKK